MPKTPVASTVEALIAFEPEFIAGLTRIFEEAIVFNTVLGLKIASITPQRVTAHIAMRPDLVGHFSHNRIHGDRKSVV